LATFASPMRAAFCLSVARARTWLRRDRPRSKLDVENGAGRRDPAVVWIA